MAQFPTTESKVVSLALSMMAGYSEHPDDFPSANPTTLGTVYAAFSLAKNAQTNAIGAAKMATESKNVALAEMETFMHAELKKSEVDVETDPTKLDLIGWGPRNPASPTLPPGQPRNLEPISEGNGTLALKWRSAVHNSGGAVRTYLIERREQPAGGGEFGEWLQAGISIDPEAVLSDQPRSRQMEYRVKGINIGGESIPSNTISVVL